MLKASLLATKPITKKINHALFWSKKKGCSSLLAFYPSNKNIIMIFIEMTKIFIVR